MTPHYSSAQTVDCAPNVIIDCKDHSYQPKLHLEMMQTDFVKGDIIDVLMIADDFNYVSSIQFTLTFNPYLLELVDIPGESLTPALLNESVADQGNIAVIWFNASASGVCLADGATMFRFQFEIKEVKGVDNLIQITSNLAEREIGLTLDLNNPSCARSFEVEDVIIEPACPEFCIDIDICQADFVSGSTTVDFEICGGSAPYTVSVLGLPDEIGGDNEAISFTIENIFSETSFLFTFEESDGTMHDTTLTFNPVIGVDVGTMIIQPSCDNISNGSIMINSISSGISTDLADFQFEWSGGFFNTPELNGLSNGTYFLTITDPFGCEYLKSFDLFTAGLELFDLDVTTSCSEDEKIAFQYQTLNPLDEINQVLVRDQNFVNYPNETSIENRYFNNDLPPGIYTISIFTQNGCSIDTTFSLLGDITRIGGTVWIDENRDGLQNEDLPLAGIFVNIYNCGELSGDPLGTASTNAQGEFAYFVNEGEYQFAIADSLFELDGNLALFELESEVISANEQIDGDNNLFFESEVAGIAGVTECVIVSCPQYVTATSEDMSIDLGVLIQSCDNPQELPPFFKNNCEEIAQDLENNVICDLSVLDQYCGSLRTPEPVIDFTPYCLENETADNIYWFAFYAPEGDAIIEIDQIGCYPGRNGVLGMHAGIYRDCGLTDMVWCSSDNCTPGLISTPLNLLEPGVLYYMFLDGCSGSICDFEIDITCVAGDCNIPAAETVFNFPSSTVCGPESILPQMTDENGELLNWPTILDFEMNNTNQTQNFNFSDTIASGCGTIDIFNLDVTVLVDSSSSVPLIACEQTPSSIIFFWLPTTNTSEYEIEVINGPQAGIYDAFNLTYTVNGLLPEQEVEIQVTAINNTDCGNDGVSSISCSSSPSSTASNSLNEIKIFPNPVSDNIYIDGIRERLNDAHINVYTPSGACVINDIESSVFDVSHLPAGIYLISIQIKNEIVSYRFVKYD